MTLALDSRPNDSNFYTGLKARKPRIEAEFRRNTPRSAALFERAQAMIPGGFSRDAVMRSPYSPYVAHGRGSRMTDVDGRTITDFWFNATSLPLGHADPDVIAAAQAQAEKGTAFFAPTEIELDWAETIVARLPGAEQIRFTNSGSEAVMMALRFGRAAAGRSLVVKFEGSYHGSHDDMSWSVSAPASRLGDPARPTPVAEGRGLAPAGDRVLVLPFNDTAALEEAVTRRHREIGVIIVEPMANRMGLILPDSAFLATARRLADRHGITLIFDEVIAFRLGYHGAQGELGITPDLTTLGKVIGGGFPVGAVVGKREILSLSRPDVADRVSHAGTFNGNPMTASAGLATLKKLTPDVFTRINAMGARIRERLTALCDGLPLQVTGAGSLFKITATDRRIRNYRDAVRADKGWESVASLALLNAGYLLTTTLAGCVSAVTTDEEADGLLAAFAEILEV